VPGARLTAHIGINDADQVTGVYIAADTATAPSYAGSRRGRLRRPLDRDQ
jgi:hypothetical protein